MSNLIEQHGGGPQKQPRYVPIFLDRSFTGLYTQRAVLHDPADIYTSKFYGGRPDALWMGKNIELTNRLTLQRRPGLSLFSSATYPTPPNRSFAFQLSDGTIRVIIDTSSTSTLALTSVAAPVGPFTLSAVAASSGGVAVYTGTITAGGANAYAGQVFTITGFTNTSNNGTFLCSASSITTLTLANASAVAETLAAVATGQSAVYTGTITGGVSNSLLGHIFLVAGFANGPNNGSFVSTLSSATTLILTNPGAVAETLAATAVSSGAVFWDKQDGTKLILFAKSPKAGQTYFQAVGGILYMGDGVDTRKWTPLNPNLPPGSLSSVWNWGIVPPNKSQQPSVTIVASGAATTVWQANTIFSTMGLTVDTYGQAWQLIGVNADGTNTTNAQFGTAGNGAPSWNQSLYGTTTDGGVTWKNLGKISQWQASFNYGDAGVAGVAAPVGIFDPATTSIYLNFNNNGALSLSGTQKPRFNGVAGSSFWDNGAHWFFFGKYTDMKPWLPSHAYTTWYSGAAGQPTDAVIEPFLLPPPTDNPIYLQIPSVPGTTAASYAPFQPNSSIGKQQPDAQLLWMALGSATWKANVNYTAWTAQGTPFGCVQSGGNMHVCISGTRSGGSLPTFGILYGNLSSLDGDIIWVCVGPQVTWVVGSATAGIWNLPPSGFQPPQASQAFGGSVVNSSTNLVEATVNSGKSGASAPTWTALNFNTADGGSPLTLTSVAVAGTTTTYNGTITGGAANAFAGFTFLMAGFTNIGNNGRFYITASTATTLVCTTVSQVNETIAATATTGLIWFAEAKTTTNSLVTKTGLAYAYSFKARAFDDFYSPLLIGGGNIPPGSTFGALGPPTGSATNAVSTASPAFIIVGGNTGAVNTISGLGSTDPQVDTIIIWRSFDGGGPALMFELTEIPAPKPIGGIAQRWQFQDFLPDNPTALYPGLNTLIPAPISSVNNPPNSAFLPMAYNFQRIWGGVGQFVPFSGGPDTRVGNPNEAFSPVNSLPFLATVIRLVKTPQGLVTFLTDSIEVIAGGPLTSSFFSVTWAPGIGLQSFNALDVLAGEMYFFTADNQFRIMTPSLNIANAGFAIGDQFANLPSSGASDATWDAKQVYVASYQNGIDNCIFAADGSTGWYRLNPHQAGATAQTEPVWSPFAAVVGGCKMVQAIETSPGIKKLLVGASNSASGGVGVGINLLSATTYGVLAGTTVANSNATTINGDLGLSPGSSVTGAPTVTGATNINNAAAAKAKIDLKAAYIAAAAYPGTLLASSELGGLTLGPGAYAAPGGAFAITSVDLILDAGGNSNALWVFQMTSTLTVGNGRTVSLINGAQAKNVFWQVGSSATIGTTVNFSGTILALTSITIQTSATFAGRALARNGAVTMDTNTITSPSVSGIGVGLGNNKSILARDLTLFTDNGTQYGSFFVMGSISLVHPGQLSLLKFMEFDMSGVNFQPQVSYLLNEVSGAFTPFTVLPVFDPPSIYGGRNVLPSTYSPLRYYLLSNASLARARHLQLKVDFGTTPNGDELLNATIFGRLMVEV